MIVSKLLRILLLGTLLVSGTARAVGLGEMNLQSRTGDPIRAELPIHAAGESLDVGCITLATVPGADFPVITAAKLQLIRLGQDYRLIILGSKAIGEPVFVINIRIGCGFELQREYVLLPAPPLTPAYAMHDDETSLPSAQPYRRQPRKTDNTRPTDEFGEPVVKPRRQIRPAGNEQSDHGSAPKPASRSPLGQLAKGRDRIILSAGPEELPHQVGSTPLAAANEVDERLLKMETTLHLLNAEVDKLSAAFALGAESRAARRKLQELQALQPAAGPLKAVPPQPSRTSKTLDAWIELLIGVLLGGALSATVAHLASRRNDKGRPFDAPAPRIAKPRAKA